jgi:hypothetical protein
MTGVGTTATGSALVLGPDRFGPMMGLTEPAMTRVIGVAAGLAVASVGDLRVVATLRRTDPTSDAGGRT